MNPQEVPTPVTRNHISRSLSSASLASDNYYDILIKASKRPKPVVHPKRLGSQTNITEHEAPTTGTSTGAGATVGAGAGAAVAAAGKRPGDYYIQKLSNSSVNLAKRPISGDSIMSLNSNFSDEVSVNSSNFDPHDSRLSSLTSNSITSPNDSPKINSYKLDDSVNESLSTITSDKARPSPRPAPIISNSAPVIPLVKKLNSNAKLDTFHSKGPKTKPLDSNNNSRISVNDTTSSSMNASIDSSLNDSMSIHSSSYQNKPMSMSTSNLSLTRTKTKYLSQEDIKKRQRLRKQQYEDSYNEDEILGNDMDLVFNVPVIKNQNELYMKKNIRNNLVDNDNYKPFPLPGKLRSNSSPNVNLSVNTSIDSLHEIPEPDNSRILDDHLAESTHAYSQEIIEEEDEDADEQGSIDDTSFGSNEHTKDFNASSDFVNDSQIVSDISNYYTQRSKSYSKFVQMSRHEHMMYKLPNYIKSQSSIDDLNLMSPEKLMFVDQTRPINLPPKASNDKVKHNKELHKMINDFNNNGFGFGEETNFNEEINCENDWDQLLKLDDDRFVKRLVNEKNVVRKLNWDSNCPSSERYDYFMRLLTIPMDGNSAQELTDSLVQSFNRLENVYSNLSESIKVNRDVEFDKSINDLISRPLINSIINTPLMEVDSFKKRFKKLLYIKSLDNNLHTHDETFLIPISLIIFPTKSLLDQYIMIEVLNQQIFNKDLIYNVNNNFDDWTTKLPKKASKFLNNINLKEFDGLNFNNLFKILLQFNDKLPLSMSASNPSTPIMNLSYKKLMISSCSVELIFKFLQLLVVYNVNSKTKSINHLKLFQSFLMVVIKYYHINWLDHNELTKNNKSIKLNFNIDNLVNLNSFNDKWKHIFKSI